MNHHYDNQEPKLMSALVEALALHRYDVDLQGEPYILHPLRVMLAVRTAGGSEAQQVAALLHDALEDHRELVSLDAWHMRYGSIVVLLVQTLTRDKERESYQSYIERVWGTPEARLIKRCDIEDNLARIPDLAGMSILMATKAQQLANRYRSALAWMDGQGPLAALSEVRVSGG